VEGGRVARRTQGVAVGVASGDSLTSLTYDIADWHTGSSWELTFSQVKFCPAFHTRSKAVERQPMPAL